MREKRENFFRRKSHLSISESLGKHLVLVWKWLKHSEDKFPQRFTDTVANECNGPRVPRSKWTLLESSRSTSFEQSTKVCKCQPCSLRQALSNCFAVSLRPLSPAQQAERGSVACPWELEPRGGFLSEPQMLQGSWECGWLPEMMQSARLKTDQIQKLGGFRGSATATGKRCGTNRFRGIRNCRIDV